MSVHIHRPATTWHRRVGRCPVCKTRRRLAVSYADWYGATVTCCACGAQWSDGVCRREGKRVREARIAAARAVWRKGTP